jgi:hypothetical protein
MRIDGRFDPRQWIQPQPEVAEVFAPIVGQRLEFGTTSSGSGHHEIERDFAAELQQGYSYTHASRMAATVAEMLEATPDL